MRHIAFLVVTSICLSACAATPPPEEPEAPDDGDVAYSKPSKASKQTSGTRVPINELTSVSSEVSDDATYGYSKHNPIMVGGTTPFEGPRYEMRFLDLLVGPNGERIRYTRRGNCCSFDTPNGFMGGGLLDVYDIAIEGGKNVTLYLNMYDPGGIIKIPRGFMMSPAATHHM